MIRELQKGDRIWHYLQRRPLTVIKIRKNRKTGDIIYVLQSDKNDLIEATPQSLEHIPDIGDRVIVLLTPYMHWKQEEWSKKSKFEQYKTRDELDRLRYSAPEWLNEVFQVRNIIDGMATLIGGGHKVALPIYCLAVLERKQQALNNQEISA